MFQALARDRLQRLNASPSATPWTYFRVYSILLFVFFVDVFWYFLNFFIFALDYAEIASIFFIHLLNMLGDVYCWIYVTTSYLEVKSTCYWISIQKVLLPIMR